MIISTRQSLLMAVVILALFATTAHPRNYEVTIDQVRFRRDGLQLSILLRVHRMDSQKWSGIYINDVRVLEKGNPEKSIELFVSNACYLDGFSSSPSEFLPEDFPVHLKDYHSMENFTSPILSLDITISVEVEGGNNTLINSTYSSPFVWPDE